MSLVLKAFPLGFLINHDLNEGENVNHDLKFERENLCLIKVATNLRVKDVSYLMENLGIAYKYRDGKYYLSNGLCVSWESYQGHYSVFISSSEKNKLLGKIKPNADMAKQGELLFKRFDVLLKRNTRDVSSKEIFHYCYKTNFKTKRDVLESLKEHHIENITRSSENEIRFKYNNKNYKFKRNNKNEMFYLESEQIISLVNISAGKKSLSSRNIKTNYTNMDVLLRTLDEHGAQEIQSDKYNIYCEISGMQFMFSRNNTESAYYGEIDRIADEDVCDNLLEELEAEYGLNIQDVIYKKIMERIKDKNMRVENEEVGDDNSIVLTIDLG